MQRLWGIFSGFYLTRSRIGKKIASFFSFLLTIPIPYAILVPTKENVEYPYKNLCQCCFLPERIENFLKDNKTIAVVFVCSKCPYRAEYDFERN